MFALAEPRRLAEVGEEPCLQVLRDGRRCPYAPASGDIYCRAHTREGPQKRFEYALALSAPRVAGKDVFDLTAEVRLLKQLIQARLALVKDDNSLILAAGPVGELVAKVQKLVTAAVHLEEKKGELLSRERAMALIGHIMNIVADVVKDADIIEQINEKILEYLAEEETQHESKGSL